jgi:ABC-type phosphate transport system auxiliary subunit
MLLFALFRISFLGSFGLLSVLVVFGLMHWWPDPLAMAAVVLTVGAIVWFHRANITGFMAQRR